MIFENFEYFSGCYIKGTNNRLNLLKVGLWTASLVHSAISPIDKSSILTRVSGEFYCCALSSCRVACYDGQIQGRRSRGSRSGGGEGI